MISGVKEKNFKDSYLRKEDLQMNKVVKMNLMYWMFLVAIISANFPTITNADVTLRSGRSISINNHNDRHRHYSSNRNRSYGHNHNSERRNYSSNHRYTRSNNSYDSEYAGLWETENDPLSFTSSGEYELRLNKLPLKGKLDVIPWASDYWPLNKGGISYRYQTEEIGFKYKLHTKEEVLRMSKEELEKLSPAEKYDIYMDRFDYPLTNYQRKSCNPKAEDWEGHCHGWAPAAYHYQDPSPVTLVAKDKRIEVPFGSGDIKALLTFSECSLDKDEESVSCGNRCDLPIKREDLTEGERVSDATLAQNAETEEAMDINPGAFHIIVTNEVGINKKSFVMDVDAGRMVWNHPIYSYHAIKTDEKNVHRRASGNKNIIIEKEVSIVNDVYYVVEADAERDKLNNGEYLVNKTYRYTLFLDRGGRIIGGEWNAESKLDHPDFVWRTPAPNLNTKIDLPVDEEDENSEIINIDYSGIEQIYKSAITP